jgi:hypothetical protein
MAFRPSTILVWGVWDAVVVLGEHLLLLALGILTMPQRIVGSECNGLWVLKKSSFFPNSQNWVDTKCLEN